MPSTLEVVRDRLEELDRLERAVSRRVSKRARTTKMRVWQHVSVPVCKDRARACRVKQC